MSSTVEEWLMAAEHVAQRGNLEIVLCERGIRTFEPSTRRSLDLPQALHGTDLRELARAVRRLSGAMGRTNASTLVSSS